MKPRFPFPATLLPSALGILVIAAGGCTADGSKGSAQKTNQVPVAVVQAAPAEPVTVPVEAVREEPAAVPSAPPAPAEPAAEASAVPLPPPPTAMPADLSEPARELVQLAQARVGNDVLLAYIEGVQQPFNLKADDIVYLTDLGVPAETIASMVRRDQVFRAEAAAAAPVLTTAVPEPVQVQAAAPMAAQAVQEEPAAPTAESIAAESSQPVTYNYFYNTLSPYGTWMEVPDYGWCWQPSVAVIQPGWRPYCDGGRWLWSDCGYYWQSYYSWGWAPFHYGRWAYTGSCGWVWAPGTSWGPSWVTWRYYDGYCGWAPLPPACGYQTGVGFTYNGGSVGFSFGFGLGSSCYTFVPTQYVCAARVGYYRVSDTAVNGFYGNTTVINNYVHGNNNTIINKGIGTEIVTAATRTEVPKVRLADTGGLSGGGTSPAERLSRDGRTLAVYRPKLPEQAATPPASVTQRQEQAKARTDALLNSRTLQDARANARPAAADLPARNPQPNSGITSARPTANTARSEQPSRTIPSTTQALTATPARSTTARAPWTVDRTTPSSATRTAPSRPTAVNPSTASVGRTEPRKTTPTLDSPAWRSSPTPTRPSVIAPAPTRDIRSTLPRATTPESRLAPNRPTYTPPTRPTYTAPNRPAPQPSRSVIAPAPTLRSSPSPASRSTPTPSFRSAPPSRPSMSAPSSSFGRSAVAPSRGFSSGPSSFSRSAAPSRPSAPASAPARSGVGRSR